MAFEWEYIQGTIMIHATLGGSSVLKRYSLCLDPLIKTHVAKTSITTVLDSSMRKCWLALTLLLLAAADPQSAFAYHRGTCSHHGGVAHWD